MIRIKTFCLLVFLAFGIGAYFTNNIFVPKALSYSDGPPPVHTGGPGEGTCTECHFGNPGPGILTIFAPSNYVPGQTYQIQVQHSTTDMTRMRWGFQMTALDNANTFAGVFTNTSPFTQIDFGNLRFYIEHTTSGTFPGTTGGAQWSLDWTAPSTDVGPVTFYASGNEANNDNTFDGDQIYTTSTVTAPVGTPTPTDTPTATMTSTNTPTATATATPTGTGDNFSISGTVTYGNSNAGTKFISNATVASTVGSPSLITATAPPGANAGQYTLTVFGFDNYTIGVTKTTGMNQVTSNDAARLAQHVAGTSIIVSNGQKIAADCTNNGTLSSNDAAQIARFVAGLAPTIAGSIPNVWRFFLPGPSFPVGASPTTRSYTAPIGIQTGQDYIGILVGEVTGNWTATAARLVRSSGAEKLATVTLPGIQTSVDKEIVLPVTVDDIAKRGVISYEFDLRYDPNVIRPAEEPVDVMRTASRGLMVVTNVIEPGLLRVVTYGAIPVQEDGLLLNLRFTAIGTLGSVSPLAFEHIMFNEGEPRVTAVSGSVELF